MSEYVSQSHRLQGAETIYRALTGNVHLSPKEAILLKIILNINFINTEY